MSDLTIDFAIRGTNSIIFHADDVLKNDLVQNERDRLKDLMSKGTNQEGAAGGKKAKGKPQEDADMTRRLFVPGDDRCPAWTWMTYLYDDETNIALPSANLMKCLLQASAKFPTGKGTATFKKESQIAIIPHTEHFAFFSGDKPVPMNKIRAIAERPFDEHLKAAKALGFGLDVRRAPVKRGGAKHVRVRAKFPVGWSIRGRITLVTDIISENLFRRIFDFAGTRVGLLDWRPSSPQSPGPFGTFAVESLKVA